MILYRFTAHPYEKEKLKPMKIRLFFLALLVGLLHWGACAQAVEGVGLPGVLGSVDPFRIAAPFPQPSLNSIQTSPVMAEEKPVPMAIPPLQETPSPKPEESALPTPPTVETAKKPEMIIGELITYLGTTEAANVRSAPSAQGKIVAILGKREKVDKVGESGPWTNIRMPSGDTAWIFTAFLKEYSSQITIPANPSIPVGFTKQFAATITDSDRIGQDIPMRVTWTSSNISVATVNSNGLVTGVAAGTSTITATSGSISGSITLTVSSETSPFIEEEPSAKEPSQESSPLPTTPSAKTPEPRSASILEGKALDFRWGGELKFIGSVSWPNNGTVLQPQGSQAFYDGSADGRLKGQVFFSNWGSFEVHNLIGIIGGDTRKAVQGLQTTLPGLFTGNLSTGPPSDQTQLMNLTWTLNETKEYITYDRLDRLALTLQKDSGMLRLGRQAVTWGNGLIFNPMDLVNPFSPSDVVREYKTGQDMAFAQWSASFGNLQLVYVPRRDASTKNVEWDQSTVAGKLHVSAGTTEFDLLLAKNYQDKIVGLGSTGYLGRAAWRLDATWTFMGGEGESGGYLSLVANMDTSWNWWGKNWYGFLEFFYNGLGQRNYAAALADPEVTQRLNRGTLFTLGRPYQAGQVRLEVHPLVNIFVTVVTNLWDPSGLVQPRVTWDILKSVKLTLWGNIFYGRRGDEYGGFPVPGPVPGTSLLDKPANQVYSWLSYYF